MLLFNTITVLTFFAAIASIGYGMFSNYMHNTDPVGWCFMGMLIGLAAMIMAGVGVDLQQKMLETKLKLKGACQDSTATRSRWPESHSTVIQHTDK